MLLKAANDNTTRALGRITTVCFAAASAWIIVLGTLIYSSHWPVTSAKYLQVPKGFVKISRPIPPP